MVALNPIIPGSGSTVLANINNPCAPSPPQLWFPSSLGEGIAKPDPGFSATSSASGNPSGKVSDCASLSRRKRSSTSEPSQQHLNLWMARLHNLHQFRHFEVTQPPIKQKRSNYAVLDQR